jgi:hypothetical protein
VLLAAVFIIALSGVATSSAFAEEDPFYRVNGGRLGHGSTAEVGLKTSSATQVLKSTGAGITITCTGIAAVNGLLIGSVAGEPGTSSGRIEYSGCTVIGNGTKCIVTSIAGVKDKKILTKPLRDELVASAEKQEAGTKILDLFKAVEGPFVEIKFEPEAGGVCKFSGTTVEGSVDVEILNSKKLPVSFAVNEKEELDGFIKALPNGTKECKLEIGKLSKCTTSSLKAFGVASTLEGTSEVFLTGANAGQEFGVFFK